MGSSQGCGGHHGPPTDGSARSAALDAVEHRSTTRIIGPDAPCSPNIRSRRWAGVHGNCILGAAGFIGRNLVVELLRRGHTVAAGFRGPATRLTDWLDSESVDHRNLLTLDCDITHPNLGLDPIRSVRDVYNCAANMAFGLSEHQARLDNVTGALHVVDYTAALPEPRRLVHLTGYRAGMRGVEGASYAAGSYEASKLEADAVVRRRATELDVPLTVANPSSVIGKGQYFGLTDLVRNLHRGRLLAIPGRRDSFVPVVDVEYLAAFLVSLPEHADTLGATYNILDPTTPNLPELVALLAAHLGVKAPRRTVPVGVVSRLPRFLTHADPEALGFISSDRYDTTTTEAHARNIGLTMPPSRRPCMPGPITSSPPTSARTRKACEKSRPANHPCRVSRGSTWPRGRLEDQRAEIISGRHLAAGSARS
ncbi:NAD-dependent epimerase/dehydratase family protein [Nocardia sp. NPDC051570]|uniref:NAD-dependent epimerase/dehydratase family protein n=1 Tax=Nocardia sp. NPDC051570 TaxID=3364324 RepID=UPI0037B64917